VSGRTATVELLIAKGADVKAKSRVRQGDSSVDREDFEKAHNE
jgi:hypothetical protein